jgi:hypothetical protein
MSDERKQCSHGLPWADRCLLCEVVFEQDRLAHAERIAAACRKRLARLKAETTETA